jgi:tetratricopeptide (TPR) repeat protein
VAFSPDGRTVLTGNEIRAARRWDVARCEPLGLPFEHAGSIQAVAFSPDGRTVLTGSWDSTARLWDAATGKPLGPPLVQAGPVDSVAFSPDGRSAFAAVEKGGGEGDARVGTVPEPVSGEVGQLVLWSQVLTGMTLGADGEVHVLDAAAWQERRGRLAQRDDLPGTLPFSAEQVRTWHRRTAGRSEAERQWFAAVWHLNRLLDAEPGNVDYFEARARIRAAAGAWPEAFADHARAIELKPGDWRLRYQRGRAHERCGHWAEAAADYYQALGLKDSDPNLWADRARMHRNLGRWAEAAADHARLLDRHPEDHFLWYQAAALEAYRGDREGYQRVCRGLLERFGNTRSPYIAERAVKSCLLLAGVIEDRKRMADLTRVALAHQTDPWFLPWCRLAKTLEEYRAGRWTDAAGWAEKSLAGDPPVHVQASAWFLSAMIQHRMGRTDDARAALARAQKIIAARIPPLHQAEESWHDWLITQVLRREAEALIEGPGAHPGK